jgi:hypothetical protein
LRQDSRYRPPLCRLPVTRGKLDLVAANVDFVATDPRGCTIGNVNHEHRGDGFVFGKRLKRLPKNNRHDCPWLSIGIGTESVRVIRHGFREVIRVAKYPHRIGCDFIS